MSDVASNSKCRIFIQDNENKAWQLFSLEQRKRDGSIYLSSPEFTSFEWLTFEISEGNLKTLKLEQDKEGHLSIHGHGQAHIKSGDEKYQLPISGQHLLKTTENDISLRHLFTILPKKPEYNPVSGASKRKSDQIVKSSEPLRSFAIIAFAFPRVGLKVNFMMSLNVDDLETIPGVLGWHLFPLVHHDVFLVFYRTKFMDDWPKRTMVKYLDGIVVPVFVGKPGRMIEVQLKLPSFDLKDKELEIRL